MANTAVKKILELLTLLAAVAALSTAVTAQGALKAGDNPEIAAEYRFDTGAGDTAYDTAGNNDGTINGATWAEGKQGDALLFDSSSEDYVQTSNTLDIPQKYSMFIWIKGDLNDQLSENIYPFGFNNKVELAASSSSNARGGILIRDEADDSYHSVWDGTNVLDGEWHHWGATVDRDTGIVKVYLDGQKIHEGTIPDHYSGSRKINIGSWSDTYGHFNGKIGEARLYSEALNTSEVKSIYNTGSWRVGGNKQEKAASKVLDLDFQHVQNGQVLDTSGYNNHGNIENGASQVGAVECKVGRCFSFDGNDDYVELPSNTIANWDELTIGTWVKAPEYSGDKWPAYVGGSTTSAGNNIGIGIYQDTNHQWLEVDTSNGNYAMEGSLSIPWGEWYYATLNYNGSHLTEYINGKKGKSIPASGSLKDLDVGLHLGQQAGVTYYFDGKIGQVRTYKRSLSKKEIWKLYTRGRDRASNGIPGPVAHYPINVESAPLRDISGEGNHGSLNLLGEAGTFQTSNGEWKTVRFKRSYQDPVVIGTSNTHNGESAIYFEVKNVDSSSADMRLCESEGGSNNGCDSHVTETAGYIVIDAAATDDIPGIEAGSFKLDASINTKRESVTYSESFSNVPKVFTQVMTDNGPGEVESWLTDKDTNGFSAGICQQDSTDGCSSHPEEEVGWVAVEPGNEPFEQPGEADNLSNEIGSSNWGSTSFSSSFSSTPVGVFELQTYHGGQDPLVDEIRNVDTSGMEMRFCELQSGDNCNGHMDNEYAYLAVSEGLLTYSNGNFPRYVDTSRGKALEFDGSDDYVKTASSFEFYESDNDAWSISTWFYVDQEPESAGDMTIIDNNGRFHMQLSSHLGGGNMESIPGGEHMDWKWAPEVGKWHHATLVYDGEGNLKAYGNGELKNSRSGVTPASDPASGDFGIAQHHPSSPGNGNNRWFDGRIDDVRIYPYALNQEQISQVMNSGGVSISG